MRDVVFEAGVLLRHVQQARERSGRLLRAGAACCVSHDGRPSTAVFQRYTRPAYIRVCVLPLPLPPVCYRTAWR